MKHEIFRYRSLPEVKNEMSRVGVKFPLSEDTSNLSKPFTFGNVTLPNRFCIAPMEGADSTPEGEPSEMTRSRYIDWALGGAAVIWFESVSILKEGRSNPRQLVIDRKTLPVFQRLVYDVKEAGLKANGFAPYCIVQANHSGRYCKPDGVPEPIIAYRNPDYEAVRPLDKFTIASDGYMRRLEELFGEASRLCKEAGFDAVDIKACHGYLLAEFSSAYTREGEYGGSFENRFRALINSIKNAKQAESDSFMVTVRLGIYDGFEYPNGFGVSQNGGLTPDYSEPLRLAGIFHNELNMPLINITMGNPYQLPHIVRPFDQGTYVPPEHPFESVARHYEGCAEIKRRNPGLAVISSAPSYLRQFSPNLAAGAVADGVCDLVSFGRLAFADAGFANTILQTGGIDAKKCCVACGKCALLLRAGRLAGCVIRKPVPYLDELKKLESEAKFSAFS